VETELKRQNALRYRPFSDIDHEHPSGFPASSQIDAILADIASHEYLSARVKITSLIKTGLQGLRYLETYDICKFV
jgi:hypothetical protein